MPSEWLILVWFYKSCSIDELGQTGLEKAIKSETQGLISYSIRDKLWIGPQISCGWHRRTVLGSWDCCPEWDFKEPKGRQRKGVAGYHVSNLWRADCEVTTWQLNIVLPSLWRKKFRISTPVFLGGLKMFTSGVTQEGDTPFYFIAAF